MDNQRISSRSIFFCLCFSIPLILLIASYIHMCVFYKELWLFDTIVHENGRYTLLQVILYFRHFCWEILGKAIYSLFIVGVFFYYGRPLHRVNQIAKHSISQTRIIFAGFIVFAIILLSFLITTNEYGFREAIFGLTQYRASELRPIWFGSHWRNHFLSNIVLFSASAFLVLLYRVICFGGYYFKRRFACLFHIATGIFVFLTVLFGLTMDPFSTPSYLGHQLREIFGTDLSITMFWALAVLIHLENRYDSGDSEFQPQKLVALGRNTRSLIFWSLPTLVIVPFLITRVLSLDIAANVEKLGNTAGWSIIDLFAWHFFEHSLDYFFVVFLVYFLYALTLKIELRRSLN